MAMNPQPRSVSVSRFSARIMSTWGGSGGVLVPSSGVGALWRGAGTYSTQPPWSICHCLGKKETLERSFGAAEPACQFRWVNPRPREGVLPANLPPLPPQPRFQMSKYGGSAQCQGGISGPCQYTRQAILTLVVHHCTLAHLISWIC